MKNDKAPFWTAGLNDDEWEFIKQFLLVSGSLKDVSQHYGVTYPTMRIRLDRLIEKIRQADRPSGFTELVKTLALDNKLDLETAKLLLTAYEEEK